MELIIKNNAQTFLKKNKKDKILFNRIKKQIYYIKDHPHERYSSLKGHKPLKKVRVSEYRIIFDITKDAVIIYEIGHRKNVYKRF